MYYGTNEARGVNQKTEEEEDEEDDEDDEEEVGQGGCIFPRERIQSILFIPIGFAIRDEDADGATRTAQVIS
ncbi:MAG: hypothetical protein EZS28_022362 [Streblomastix strix]|uniref:Uncharacterized protein n=1 Tax=Streblomastix strix TaxID=222440 RepID=A0A5J4VHQ0_9EUKA|nr:MAG: hypothetical protein EZS28_022362 [Streblomastix strix]